MKPTDIETRNQACATIMGYAVISALENGNLPIESSDIKFGYVRWCSENKIEDWEDVADIFRIRRVLGLMGYPI